MVVLKIFPLLLLIFHACVERNGFCVDGFKIFDKDKADTEKGPFVSKPEKVAKNYKLVKNHNHLLFQHFDLFYHVSVNTMPEKDFKHHRYLSYQEQCNWMAELAFTKPRIATAFSIGYTVNDNEICALFLNAELANLPLVWLDGNIAARAWLSSASLISFTDYLIHSTDETAVRLRKNYRFIVVPNLNPDGYEYSRTNERMWVKNRRKVTERNATDCVGVNLNRNFDAGKSDPHDVCSQCYGAKPFSEQETLAVRTTVEHFSPFVASLSFQTYGQFWVLPYACSAKKPDDYDEMERVAFIATNNIRNKNGADYKVGKASELLRETFGGSTFDWSKLKKHTRYSYGVFLRPSTAGEGGYEVGPEGIEATGLDILHGVDSVLANADFTQLDTDTTIDDC